MAHPRVLVVHARSCSLWISFHGALSGWIVMYVNMCELGKSMDVVSGIIAMHIFWVWTRFNPAGF